MSTYGCPACGTPCPAGKGFAQITHRPGCERLKTIRAVNAVLVFAGVMVLVLFVMAFLTLPVSAALFLVFVFALAMFTFVVEDVRKA